MQFKSHLEQLRKKFAAELPDRFQHIQDLYQAQTEDEGNRAALRQALHRLTGLAGTFKANHIGEIARNLELHYTQESEESARRDKEVIPQLFAQLEKSIRDYQLQNAQSDSDDDENFSLIRSDKTICLVEDDTLQAEQIALVLEEAGYRVIIHHSLPHFSLFLTGNQPLPSLIIMDMVFADSNESGASFICDIREHIPDFPPVIFISVLSDVLSRIKAVRAGASDYLEKPLNNETLLATVDKYLRKPNTHKILIVDDDKISAEYIATIMESAGLQAKVLHEPLRIFETLEAYHPDLLILDICMPDCTGIELAQAIRQCCCYSLMPIIFLTTDTQINLEKSALSSGGDEFIRKSNSAGYLLHKVEVRLRRLSQIRDLNEQLQRAQIRSERLRKSQSDFLSYVVHELKSPLHAILGFSDLLLGDGSLNAEQTEMVNEIARSGQSQLAIINELSEHAKIVAGKLKLAIEGFDITPVLREAIHDATPLGLKADIGIISEFDPHQSQWIRADRRRVSQILNNLLSNAVKYNKPGGKIWITLQKRSNGLLRISVRDTGIGIRADDLDYVFDAFERLDAPQQGIEGTGIGLSICSRLIKMMGGHIGVDSEFNVGSHFWIELPLHTL